MAGFFNVNQYQIKKPRLSNITGCGLCRLNKSCRNPRMPAHGLGERRVMLIGEAPSVKEDKRNQTMIGAPANYLRKTLKRMNWDLDTDCVKINSVCCSTGGEDLDQKQIDGCRPHVLKEIENFQPNVIIPLGEAALKSVVGHKYAEELGGINKWRGFKIPDREYKAWICPTFHPSYIDYAIDKLPFVEKTFQKDIREALRLWDKDIPVYQDEEKSVEILSDSNEINKYLQSLIDNPPPYAAFDYEATGLKPHAPGHRIVSVAISTDGVTATAFMFGNRIRKKFCEFLKTVKIGKIAANMKFEELWSRCLLGTEVVNWAWDTMLAGHVLDNRALITGLKFQSCVNYGVYDYNSHLHHLLVGVESDNANSFNRIDEIDPYDLLIYNGVDAILEFRLAMDQMDNPTLTMDGYDLLHEGSEALADVEENGMMVDVEYCLKQQKHLKRRIEYLEEKVQRSDIVMLWKKKYRGKFNMDSDQQMADILFKQLGYEAKIFTKGLDKNGDPKPSVSEEALVQLDIPMVKDIIQIRRLKKALNTYIGNYVRESVDGVLRPFFHLHTVTTFRGSSSRINFQNQPVRIPEIKKLTRRAIIPRKGRMICEIDYGGIEVKGATFYHKDPNMIKDIVDPARDMHRDMAKECYILGDGEWTAETRYCGKNKFVFPQFYGDYYGNNARDLWSAIDGLNLVTRSGVPLGRHLASKGIKTYQQFEDHIKAVEKKFWGTRYQVYGKWKERHYNTYKKNGYVDILSGFRCIALMGKNDSINYPIQGVAFHCLLWSLIQINRWLKKNNMKTMIIGQIHDSIVFDMHPDEVNEVLEKAVQVMTVDIKKRFPFMNVPMEVDAELTPVDGSWYLKNDVSHDNGVCSCGMEWRFKIKDKQSDLVIYECPICGETEEEYATTH